MSNHTRYAIVAVVVVSVLCAAPWLSTFFQGHTNAPRALLPPRPSKAESREAETASKYYGASAFEKMPEAESSDPLNPSRSPTGNAAGEIPNPQSFDQLEKFRTSSGLEFVALAQEMSQMTDRTNDIIPVLILRLGDDSPTVGDTAYNALEALNAHVSDEQKWERRVIELLKAAAETGTHVDNWLFKAIARISAPDNIAAVEPLCEFYIRSATGHITIPGEGGSNVQDDDTVLKETLNKIASGEGSSNSQNPAVYIPSGWEATAEANSLRQKIALVLRERIESTAPEEASRDESPLKFAPYTNDVEKPSTGSVLPDFWKKDEERTKAIEQGLAREDRDRLMRKSVDRTLRALEVLSWIGVKNPAVEPLKSLKQDTDAEIKNLATRLFRAHGE